MNHDIVVIGASAGGVEATAALVRGLPADFPAAVFVVVHFPANVRSVLPRILERAGPLPAAHARDGESIEPGRIYVAPPDLHLLLDAGAVRLVRGPKENNARPAIDPLFRTAARAYGTRVIGVILTGTLDDGTAGLMAIKKRGGLAVVQDPADAMFDGMPRNAIENVTVDDVVPLAALPDALARLVREPAPAAEEPMDGKLEYESRIDRQAGANDDVGRSGDPSDFTCPECHGTLWEVREADLIRFRCRVGHAYSADTLMVEEEVALEAALWSALRSLEESAALSRRLAARAEERRQSRAAARFARSARDLEARATIVRTALDLGRADGGDGHTDAEPDGGAMSGAASGAMAAPVPTAAGPG
jgi:two-component system chemotaxis response regulator CheB